MSTALPVAVIEADYVRCGLCGQGISRPAEGHTLADTVKLVRAHQRSEVCG